MSKVTCKHAKIRKLYNNNTALIIISYELRYKIPENHKNILL